MGWRIAVAKRAVVARLPFGERLRRMKRRHFGYAPDAANLRGTIRNFDDMSACLARAGHSFAGGVVLEIGSGWFPTIPILSVMAGAEHVIMCDVAEHMDEGTIAATFEFLERARPSAPIGGRRSLAAMPISFLRLDSLEALADRSIDCVVSRAVLEHLTVAEIRSLLRRLAPKLRTDGLMVHLIDHSDHLEHDDDSITPINFLTWSARKHALINTLMKGGENRLRHREYAALFESCGYRVVAESTRVHDATRAAVNRLRLAPPYSAMPPDELATLSSIYVLARSG